MKWYETRYADPDGKPWRATAICCGLSEEFYFETWEQASAFREDYTKPSATVAEHGFSATGAENGHRRAVIVRAALEGKR